MRSEDKKRSGVSSQSRSAGAAVGSTGCAAPTRKEQSQARRAPAGLSGSPQTCCCCCWTGAPAMLAPPCRWVLNSLAAPLDAEKMSAMIWCSLHTHGTCQFRARRNAPLKRVRCDPYMIQQVFNCTARPTKRLDAAASERAHTLAASGGCRHFRTVQHGCLCITCVAWSAHECAFRAA